MSSFLGVSFTVVEHGTEVGKDADNKPMIVSDDNVVFNGSRAWVTQKVYDKLKAGLLA